MKLNYEIVLVIILMVLLLLVIRINLSDQQNEEIDSINEIGKLRWNEKDHELEIIVENLDTPWAIDFLPSGKMIFTERGGRVSLFDNGILSTIANIDVDEVSESGLAGIAVDPEFEENNYIYVYYKHEKGNRVSRFEYEKNKLVEEFILLDHIPNAQFHDGGRIKFGSDGKLYLTTGDATNPSSSQDLNSLAGKVLRLNKDGSIPEDNPFGNYVYSYGHRNPQGIAWNSKGELFASEHGPTKNDEINLINKGGNYGWPTMCSEQNSEISILPLRCYSEFTLAPSGIAFHNGELFVAGLRGSQLRKIKFDENGNIISEEELFGELGRIREAVSYDGYLYIATSNKDGRGFPKEGDDKIIRIRI